METNRNCGACGAVVESPPPDPLNQNSADGTAVTMNSRNADGEVIAQYWHASCHDAEKRRARRRGGVDEPGGDVPAVDWDREIRGVLGGETA